MTDKDRQIAFFNSLNSAISFCPEELKGTEEGFKKIIEYRDRFLDEWSNFNAPREEEIPL